MNKNDEERIEMIIAMIMYITGLSEQIISEEVKKTLVYANIVKGDEITLYDGYSANLMEMTEEWRDQVTVPSQMREITAQSVNKCNDWLRENEFEGAKEAKEMLVLSVNAEKSIPITATPIKQTVSKKYPHHNKSRGVWAIALKNGRVAAHTKTGKASKQREEGKTKKRTTAFRTAKKRNGQI